MARAERVCPWQPDHDAHLIRRLGAAVARRWAELPADVQQSLLAEITLLGNAHEPPDLQQRIESFAMACRSNIPGEGSASEAA